MIKYTMKQAVERLSQCPTPMAVSVINSHNWLFDIAFPDTVYGTKMLKLPKSIILPANTPKQLVFKSLKELQR